MTDTALVEIAKVCCFTALGIAIVAATAYVFVAAIEESRRDEE